MAAISSCSNNNNEFKVKLKKTLPAIGNDDVTLKEPMNNCASQNGTQTCSLSSCYSSDPILMNIVHQLNIPDKLLLTPKKSFDKSRACKENETESNLTLTNTNETTNITTTTISKTLDFERLQARRRMELMQKNAELIKKFSHFKFDSFDAEEEEHDEEFAKESKDKVIRTFSANESVVEVTKDEFEPKFIKDINFEILKHPDSEQKINIKSENLLEPNFPVNRSTTKSSSKKKLPVCSNSKSLKSSLKKYPIKANVKINLDSKLALAVERKVDASSSDQKKSPVRSVSNEHLDKEKIKKKCLTESLDQSNCCLTESLPQSKSNDNEKKHVCNESKRSNNFDKLEKLIKNIGTKHENDNQAREKKQSTAGNGSNSSRIKNISVNGKPYQVLNKIGKGGSSLVYQVYCAETKQTLALKIVNLKSADKSVVEGFRSEINVLQKLRNCERVVKMYDYQFCNNNKELLIVMEKGDTDLSNVLKNHFQANRNYRFSPHLIKLYWQEMVDAVREIHENNIVHSDLKPVNFILVSGKLKLIDFGIAKAMQCNQTNVYKDTIIGLY